MVIVELLLFWKRQTLDKLIPPFLATMAKFNTKLTTRTENLAGGVAYAMRPEQELLHAVLTTFLEDKYYESGIERAERVARLVTQNEPQFVANLAVIARNEFNLRSVTTLLIGELSRIHRGDSLVRDTIMKSVIRVDDLTELVAYLDGKLPKQVKRGIRNAILRFDRYQLAKYRSARKAASLVDVFNLVHPKVQHASEEQAEAWRDLINGRLVSLDTWETEISNAKDDDERTKKWEDLVKSGKIGYMALLRNLNNLLKYNVADDVIRLAAERIANEEDVLRSKQLPFRFTTAYRNVVGNRILSDAIAQAMDIAVTNTPELSGKTLIAIDSSGSMDGEPVKKAAIFGATLAKANINADVILYDTMIKEVTFNSRVPVVDLAQRIEQEAMGGGTETSLVFKYASEKAIKYDRFIIISDNESWSEGYSDESVQSRYNEYRTLTQTDPWVYAIDIQGYGTKDIEGGKVRHLTGWSHRLLDFVAQVEKGESLINYVRNYNVRVGG